MFIGLSVWGEKKGISQMIKTEPISLCVSSSSSNDQDYCWQRLCILPSLYNTWLMVHMINLMEFMLI